MNLNLEGVRAIPFKGTLIRSSFEDATGFLHVKYGAVTVNFAIKNIPKSEDLNLNLGLQSVREIYLQNLFQHVMHASLEFYVLALKSIEHSPINEYSLKKVGELIYERLCKLFSAKLRNQDIAVICNDLNNPPSVRDDKDVAVTVHFKAGTDKQHFHSIEISQRYHSDVYAV